MSTLRELAGPLLAVAGAYGLGCFNPGYYLVRWVSGTDLRSSGSGNAGAANAGRVLGPRGFALTLFVDGAKGAFAVFAAGLAGFPPAAVAAVMIAVVAGHLWPIQLGFRGGKGAATACGALLLFNPQLTALLLGFCGLLVVCTRRPAASVVASLATGPVLAACSGYNWLVVVLLAALAGAVAWAHRRNLRDEFRRGAVTPTPPVAHEP